MSALVEVVDLSVAFEAPASRRAAVPLVAAPAVDGLSWSVDAGETLAIVGESGSGKSVAQLAFFDLLPRGTRVSARSMRFAGRELATLPARERRALCGKEMALVFQDPRSSLHPRLTIGAQLAEVLETHLSITGRDATKRVAAALGEVGIAEPELRARAYPHELSGGMCQRVTIAMALLARPKLIVADEPTTALDVTLAAQILELLDEQRRRHGLALILITHALGIVAERADRVLVVYAGRAAESGPTRDVLGRPEHPYTSGLLASVPRLDGDPARPLSSIAGQPPDPSERPFGSGGCAFAPRCAERLERCASERPAFEPAPRDESRRRACWNPIVSEPGRAAEARP